MLCFECFSSKSITKSLSYSNYKLYQFWSRTSESSCLMWKISLAIVSLYWTICHYLESRASFPKCHCKILESFHSLWNRRKSSHDERIKSHIPIQSRNLDLWKWFSKSFNFCEKWQYLSVLWLRKTTTLHRVVSKRIVLDRIGRNHWQLGSIHTNP